YAHGRIIDLSRRAAQLLGFQKQGTARVRVKILADQSRAVATRFKGQTELASIGSPITVDSLPKPKVSSEALPVLGSQEIEVPTSVAPPPPPKSAAITTTELPFPGSGIVTVEPVSPTNVYIQAGAFANYENANRVRARLYNVGPVRISPVLINGRDLFRVRVGPMASIDAADRMLERVIEAGYTDARTLVD
ncbi:MAG TPA: SPOR domain-containing protein, partial [Rhodospirillales bacterium]|nr:SPOR domain-containing protein [Rhodospirillales bacterium]